MEEILSIEQVAKLMGLTTEGVYARFQTTVNPESGRPYPTLQPSICIKNRVLLISRKAIPTDDTPEQIESALGDPNATCPDSAKEFNVQYATMEESLSGCFDIVYYGRETPDDIGRLRVSFLERDGQIYSIKDPALFDVNQIVVTAENLEIYQKALGLTDCWFPAENVLDQLTPVQRRETQEKKDREQAEAYAKQQLTAETPLHKIITHLEKNMAIGDSFYMMLFGRKVPIDPPAKNGKY